MLLSLVVAEAHRECRVQTLRGCGHDLAVDAERRVGNSGRAQAERAAHRLGDSLRGFCRRLVVQPFGFQEDVGVFVEDRLEVSVDGVLHSSRGRASTCARSSLSRMRSRR